ncbi:protein phosphatase 2C domain-containing protein [Dactylosporangium sp. NPDC049140]|uniref:protein phosphatase 2C domain-containing protein n=1 Tax=Dactylosporangium sp. NPDC049140 TaxID=3155647 RepID=UPI00340F8530
MSVWRRRPAPPATVGAAVEPGRAADPLGNTAWTTQPRLSADGGSTGALTVRAASVIGRAHAAAGHTREDAFALGRAADGTAVMAVADGLGDPAAHRSALGAQLAAMEACRLVRARLDGDAAIDAVALCAQVGAAVLAAAARIAGTSLPPRALSTTLTVAWVAQDGRYTGVTLGDGGAYVLGRRGLDRVSGEEDGFDGTVALPGGHAAAAGFTGRLDPGAALLLATDGLAGPAAAPDVRHYLRRRWRRPPAIAEFLGDLSFHRRGETDDRTAAGVWFQPREDPR